ncbi:hypothetical protein DYH09_02580 [bacterium CPR1]|nr:hypothetical protein [bacterium CPR1]
MGDPMRTLLFCLLMAAALAAETLTVPDLFAGREKYSGQEVLVGGTIKGYAEKPEQTSFLLFDSGKAVSVYLPRAAGYANNEKAIVRGTFHLEKKLGGRIFTNVIEATSIEPSQE